MFAASRALRKLVALPRRERSVLFEAALLLPAVHALQTLLPFRRWRSLLTVRASSASRAPRPGAPSTPPDAIGAGRPTAEEIAWAIERARVGVPGVYKCLPQAYAGHLLLHRYGYDSVVQVGVARDAKGGVEAHAWVEREGRVLIGELPDLGRFVPLPPLKV
ncbi:MAG: hypothetical protein JWN48_2 [Myxococcaceae bacterium]|nr:hypothetical protein [Myxococcaceae bacterium]